MIRVLLKTDIKKLELEGSPVKYETYWAVLERPITDEESIAVLEEIEKAGDDFIQVTSRAGGDPIYLRASTIKAVRFIEVNEEEK